MNEAPIAFGVVILAAGASTRMGTCKLLLPWGEKTILTHLLDQWRSTGAAQIAPVIDPSNQPLRKALAYAGFSPSAWIENPSPQLGMFSSLQEASRWTGWLPTLTHWIISLGDQPHIQISTLCLLLDAARKNPTHICQPALNGHTAHPIILPASDFRELAQNDIPDRLYRSQRVDRSSDCLLDCAGFFKRIAQSLRQIAQYVLPDRKDALGPHSPAVFRSATKLHPKSPNT